MGFFEGLGSFMGTLVEKGQQLQERIKIYRPEYENMSNAKLKEELNRWKSKSGAEAEARRAAIRKILEERGVM